MAFFSLALIKRFLSSTPLISRSLLRPVASSSSAAHFFNTNAVRNLEDVDGHFDRSYISRRDDHYDYSRVIDFGPFLEFHNARDFWNSSDDFEILLVDMPGLCKEDVKISLNNEAIFVNEQSHEEHKTRSNYYSLIIKGEGLEEHSIALPPNLFKLDQIKVEMKNGVIKVILPIIKKEEKRTYVTTFNPLLGPGDFNVEID